ncbi:MAG: sensor domain-containing diguanylate cyclase [Pseudomonadota bacterium]
MSATLFRAVSALVMAGLGVLGYLLYERQLAWSVTQKSIVAAEAWVDYLDSRVPDMSRLMGSSQDAAAVIADVDAALAALGLFELQFFDRRGELTFSVGQDGVLAATETAAPLRDPGAHRALMMGQTQATLERSVPGEARPMSYGIVHVPVTRSGVPLGVIKAYVDTTSVLATTQAAYSRFALIVTALAFAMLAIPTLHWYSARRETRRKNAALKEAAAAQAALTHEVRLIAELNEWLQLSRSQSELFDLVVRFMTKLLPASEGEVYVYSNSRDVLDGCVGWGGGEPRDQIHPEDCWSLRRGRTYEHHASDIGFPCAHVDAADDRPYRCMPLLANGETIGLLHMRQHRAATTEQFRAERRLAQVCAEHLSMAIANVRMRDELQDQSIRDALTGLYNRRHLTDALRRHMAFAAREGTTVALLSIDVDFFKRFNDNYGHDAGDMVLRAVGEVLERGTNGNELACRPGGEEFMVVLPDSSVPDALHRAETLREQIQSISLRYGEKTLPSITASFGVALSPQDGSMPQDLMRAADAALYAAKAGGRNRAVLTSMLEIEREESAVLNAQASVLSAAE